MNDKNTQIIILDYSVGMIYMTEVENHKAETITNDNITDFYDYLNEKYDLSLKESQCSYMIGKNLDIEFLEP